MASETHHLQSFLAGSVPPPPGFLGPGDDGCLLPVTALAGEQLVLSTDAQEEDVHFRVGWLSLQALAYRTLGSALSDLAAMGARPLGYLLSIAWPLANSRQDAADLAAGLRAAEQSLACPLLGGDTDVRQGPLRLEATVVGATAQPLLRSTGQAGDLLYVSGPLGGAAAVVRRKLSGVELPLQEEHWQAAVARFERPTPRLSLGQALSRIGAGTASPPTVIDLSDGLRPDLSKLAAASGLAAELDESHLPIHPAARRQGSALELALEGGEDYELLVACSAATALALETEAPAEFASLIPVGTLRTGQAGHVAITRSRKVGAPLA